MSFKQFLMDKYGLDMAAFKRKPNEVRDSISKEYDMGEGEAKKTAKHYRKVNQHRRDFQRDVDRKRKQEERLFGADDYCEVDDYDDGGNEGLG